MLEVVAALIWDHDRFLICQRPANKTRPLLWEYVGGKVEPGETKEAALARECKEELNITVSVHSVFFDVVHMYPDITIHLTLFNVSISDGEITLLEHNDLRWILPSEIPRSSKQNMASHRTGRPSRRTSSFCSSLEWTSRK